MSERALLGRDAELAKIGGAVANIVVPTIPITASTNITTNHLVLRRASD